MKLNDLVHLLANHDALAARQWVADALRAGVVWTFIPKPDKLGVRELAIAAGVVELLAQRAGQPAPAWTSEVEPAPDRCFSCRRRTRCRGSENCAKLKVPSRFGDAGFSRRQIF